VVECHLAKVNVEGSNPFSRSVVAALRRRGEVLLGVAHGLQPRALFGSTLAGMISLLRLGFAIALFGSAGACGGSVADPSCTVPAGTYTEHFAPQAGCAAIAAVSYTFPSKTTLAVLDAGVGCSGSVDSMCTVTYACTRSSGGVTTQSTESLAYGSDGTATGKLTQTVSGNGPTTTCTYDVTVTK
jgi:hypothetical protein